MVKRTSTLFGFLTTLGTFALAFGSCSVLEDTLGGLPSPTPAASSSASPEATATPTPSPTPPALPEAFLAWSFESFADTATKTVASDLGSLTLAPSVATNSAAYSLGAGVSGQAVIVDQTTPNYYLVKPSAVPATHPLNTLASAFTLEGWVRVDTLIPAGTTSSKYLLNRTAWQLYLSGASGEQNTLQFKATLGGATKTLKYTADSLQAGLWYHVAVTYDGSALVLYLNGSLKASLAASGTLADSSGANFKFGGDDSSNAYKNVSGAFDEWRFYASALSADQLAYRYQVNSSGAVSSPSPSASPGSSSDPSANPTPTPTASPTPTPEPTALPVGESSTINVATSSEFTQALANVKAGDTIVVTASLNTGLKVSNKLASQGHPITVKAAATGSVTLKAFTIENSEYVNVEGFKFVQMAGDAVKVYNSRHLKVLRNTFDYSGIAAAGNGVCTASGGIDDVEIAYNSFVNRNSAGTWSGSYIKASYQSSAGTYPAGIATGLHIHHNYFADMAPLPLDEQTATSYYSGDSDREAIILGSSGSQVIDTDCLIENNLFVNCDGEGEMISLKTAKNVVRYNTVINSMGSVTLRNGANSEVYGNYFLADSISDFSAASYPFAANYETGGVRVYGAGHKVYNNYFQNLSGGTHSGYMVPLVLDGGDTSSLTANGHQQPQGVYVVNNTFVDCQYDIRVGEHYTIMPKDSVIANNLSYRTVKKTFEFSAAADAVASLTFAGNQAYPAAGASVGTARALTQNDPKLSASSLGGQTILVIASDSPAIDAGQGSYDFVSQDLFGAARSGVADVGAEEFGGSKMRLPLGVSDVGPSAP